MLDVVDEFTAYFPTSKLRVGQSAAGSVSGFRCFPRCRSTISSLDYICSLCVLGFAIYLWFGLVLVRGDDEKRYMHEVCCAAKRLIRRKLRAAGRYTDHDVGTHFCVSLYLSPIALFFAGAHNAGTNDLVFTTQPGGLG